MFGCDIGSYWRGNKEGGRNIFGFGEVYSFWGLQILNNNYRLGMELVRNYWRKGKVVGKDYSFLFEEDNLNIGFGGSRFQVFLKRN